MANSLRNKRRSWRYQPMATAYALHLSEEDIPQPGPKELLINIKAASLNHRDLLVEKASLGPVKTGLLALSDGAGEVVAVGSQVTRWRSGDRVAPTFYQAWQTGPYIAAYAPSALGAGQMDGILSDYITVPETAVVKIPDNLSYEEAATLPCAGVTAWHALIARSELKAGDTLLVQGTGGVALFGLQIAKALGAKVILLSSSDEKAAHAKKLGASATINYKTTPEWQDEVMSLTDGLGASHILELGGADTFERSLQSLAASGHIAQIGVLSGFNPQPNLRRLMQINGNIHGIGVGSGEHFTALNDFITTHQIKPIIDKTYALAEAAQAYHDMAKGQHFGKLVISL